MRSAPYVLLQERCRNAAVHFSNLGGAEGGALFLGLRYEKLHAVTVLYRIVELSSGGVSEVVLTLASMGGYENGTDEYFCKTTEAWHGLACAVLLRSAFACVLGLVFKFSRHSICRLPDKKVSRRYGRQTLG